MIGNTYLELTILKNPLQKLSATMAVTNKATKRLQKL